MEPILKLKIDCIRTIRDESGYEAKFRFAVGFVGFIPLRNEPNKPLEAIFQQLENKAYYSKKNVVVLYHIFSVFEMPECTKLVTGYMSTQPTEAAPAVQRVEPQIPIQITDAFLFKIRDAVPLDRLHDLAVLGFKMENIKFKNLTRYLQPGDQTVTVLTEWRQSATPDKPDIPPYDKRGLRKALDEAGLRGAILELNLGSL